MLCYLFSFYLHEWSSPTQRMLHTIFYIAYLRICRGNLPREFAAGICRGFFVYVSEYFFVYVSKSCLYGSKSFLYMSKTFWFARFSLLTVFLFVIAVAVMGHRRKQTPTQEFSYKVCDIFKNRFFKEHLWTVASDTSTPMFNKAQASRWFIWSKLNSTSQKKINVSHSESDVVKSYPLNVKRTLKVTEKY